MWRNLIIGLISFYSFFSVSYAQDAQIEFVLKKLEGGVYNLYDTTIYCDFIRGANPGVDGYDAPKADQFNENLSIYRNGRDWFTETRPLVNCNDTIQLRLYKMKTASYQLKVDMRLFSVETGLTAVLQDAQLNTERVLNFGQITLINFSNSVTSSFRFRVVFRRTLVQTSSFIQLPAICRGEAINLPSTSSNSVTGSWTPAVNNTQTTTYTFIPSEGQCATSPTMTVQVNQPVTPNFAQVPAVCKGGTILLPATSTNGIDGSWSPAINNSETTTYTFTPSAGQCANTATMTVTVNDLVTPNFAQVPTVCKGGTIVLPTTSTNGINGSWSPAINNSETTTYTFTPSAGQCANTTTMTVTVNEPVTPNFAQVQAICKGGTIVLQTTSTNGISGSWLPAINNNQTTNYTFTPAAGQCANTTTMTVEIIQPATPIFEQVASVCKGSSFSLPENSKNDIGGVWSPAINSNATTTYTFTPSAGQCASSTQMTVVVRDSVTPLFTQIGPFENGATFSLPTISNNGIAGIWSPAINNNETTTYTFTPAERECAIKVTMTVVVNQTTTSLFNLNGVKAFNIYPNPLAKGNDLQIVLRNVSPGKYNVNVFNLQGILIKQTIVRYDGGNNTLAMPLGKNISSGMYIVELVSEKAKKERIKLVVE